eukprot:5399637-Alexandrium_andersonii.AAC.1
MLEALLCFCRYALGAGRILRVPAPESLRSAHSAPLHARRFRIRRRNKDPSARELKTHICQIG